MNDINDFSKLSKSFNSIMKYNDSNRKRSQDMFKELFKVLNILTPSFGLFTSQTIVLFQVRIHCLYELFQ